MENAKDKIATDSVPNPPGSKSRKEKKNKSKSKKVDQKVPQKVEQIMGRTKKPKKKKVKTQLEIVESSHKLIVRSLPPLLTSSSFLGQIYKFDSGVRSLILSCYYVQGEYPANPYIPFVHSRCYIQCIDEPSLISIGKMIKTMKFADDQKLGEEKEELRSFSPSIEKAIFSSTPPLTANQVRGNINNTINDDSFYKQFKDYCDSTGYFEKKETEASKAKVEHPTDIFTYIENTVEKNKNTTKPKKVKQSKKKEPKEPNESKKNPDVKKQSKNVDDKGKATPKRKQKKKVKTPQLTEQVKK